MMGIQEMPMRWPCFNQLSHRFTLSIKVGTIHNPVQQELGIIRLLAKLPTMTAFSYKKSLGEPFIYPNAGLGYCANFLNMMFSNPSENYYMNPDVVAALDMLLILHANHEQNCSTSTVRLVGSSQSNLYSSITAGIGALWGPLHRGS